MRLLLLVAVLAAACSHRKPLSDASKAPAAVQIAARGMVESLRLQGARLFFCDAQGAHGVDLKTGVVTGKAPPCPAAQEPNAACGGLKMDVTVRAPLSEPNDIVDLAGSSFPLQGRVHDCKEAGDRLAIITGSTVVLIDAAKNTSKEIALQGGDRVAVGDNWMAWTNGSSVHAATIP